MDKLTKIIENDAKDTCKKIDFTELLGKSIMITGASGLIGTYFLACLKILNDKNPGKIKVIAVMQNESSDHLKSFLNFNNADIYKGDLTNIDFCKELPSADYIIHAAGYGQPGLFMKDPVKTLKLNTLTTYNLFEKLSINGKFLFVSSSEVYSGSPNLPYKETDIGTTNTTHPRSCYIEAKRCGEAICKAYYNLGIEAKSARLSLAYGPGTKKNDSRVINSFIKKAIDGKIELLDEGKAKRTYCYVSDAIEIMWGILFSGKDPIYNVGGKSKTTIGELAKKIGFILNVPVIFPKSSTNTIQGAPEDVFLDMSKIEKEFHKNKYIPLDKGLKKTINWQLELYNN
ncbi:MAG: NAD-dependent epimerase/dehydratase family protein [Candidatus Pacebacteria bacterium]|nr:NAD-dependent epimerase/dehydratase family protein [Candidatus Paceibacterota bacterium]